MAGQHIVVDFATRQHLGQRMPDQLADAELALRWTGGFLGSAIGHDGCQTLAWSCPLAANVPEGADERLVTGPFG